MDREERTAEVFERGSDITRITCPESNGDSPRLRVGIAILDVLRDLVPLESPDGNLCIVPKHSENSTGGHVEGMASTSFDVGESATVVVTARAQALS